MYLEDPEMHMYDCPGTLPGGGCEECKGWEGRTFADIRAELSGTPATATVPAPRRASPVLEAARAPHHADHCERLVYEGGTCTCHGVDEYDREPADMIDLEDGVHSWW
ncbi:hypothetical protein ACFXD5_23760 [Streptomyces sp. NPDC059385]|uniref:hypothetical protein n=1 Tax=Streptomyces sp. NPDC059385 TaxID=3346817 RepID=UPI0036CEF14F